MCSFTHAENMKCNIACVVGGYVIALNFFFFFYNLVSFISIAFDRHMLRMQKPNWQCIAFSLYLRNVQKYLNDEITVAITALLIVNVDLKFLPINSTKWHANTLQWHRKYTYAHTHILILNVNTAQNCNSFY